MKKGYTVESEATNDGDECVIVINYHVLNQVFNYPRSLEELKNDCWKGAIGAWKIKKLN